MSTSTMSEEVSSRRIQLLPESDEDNLSILKQATEAPVVIQQDDQGEDLVCGACKKSTVAQGIGSNDLWDLAFQCFQCGSVIVTNKLPETAILPNSKIVEIPPGVYLITTVQQPIGIKMVGTAALDRRSSALIPGSRFQGTVVLSE